MLCIFPTMLSLNWTFQKCDNMTRKQNEHKICDCYQKIFKKGKRVVSKQKKNHSLNIKLLPTLIYNSQEIGFLPVFTKSAREDERNKTK